MKLEVQIKINDALYLRDPERSELGKNIIKHGIQLIQKTGFETFTFKKLAEAIGTTEASIYRYFENKHKLLLYIISWYWGWLEFQIVYQTKNLQDSKAKLIQVVKLLANSVEDDVMTGHVDESLLHKILIAEGTKSCLTKYAVDDNKIKYFQPYKDLCNTISKIILEYNDKYKYPHSLASSIIEVAHLQNFFTHNLPDLSDFDETKKENKKLDFLNNLVFSSVSC